MEYKLLLVEDDIQISEIIIDYFTDKSKGMISITRVDRKSVV